MAMMRTNTASTISAMAPAVMSIPFPSLDPSIGHERRRAPDLHDLDARARLVRLVVQVGAGGPHLAVDPDATEALVVGDALQHHRRLAHQRRGAGAQVRRHAALRAGDG